MVSEQSFYGVLNIQSVSLCSILMEYKDLMDSIEGKVDLNATSVMIESNVLVNFCQVPENRKDLMNSLVDVLEDALGKKVKPIKKAIKKAKKVILDDIDGDWLCIETCTGTLAKDMSQIAKDIPDIEEASRVEKYIYESTFKDGKYLQTQRAVYYGE